MSDFVPKPENDFNDFIEVYYSECKKRIPRIEAIAGKWTFEDLIPGMSDFDTRLICSDDMTVQDWCDMSEAVGKVHLDLCERYPHWARNLEHLPGINLTWSELEDDFTYYPEYKQWSFYNCSNPERLKKALDVLSVRKWSSRDEYFHLKKFLTYYGPYIRGIDPAINLGKFENKYPVHSRMMHYFTPPVQSAMSIILKRPIRGKLDALRRAGDYFKDQDIFAEILKAVDKHYEVVEYYTDAGMKDLEIRLYKALTYIKDELKKHLDLIPEEELDDVALWKKAINKIPVSPQLVIFDSSRFSRLMKGRLRFYANVPGHFDNIWLIQNELKRIGEGFYRTPYRIYHKLLTGEEPRDVDDFVRTLVPDILTQSEVESTLEFSCLTPGTWEEGKEEDIALKIAAVFDEFFKGLNKVINKVRTDFQEEK